MNLYQNICNFPSNFESFWEKQPYIELCGTTKRDIFNQQNKWHVDDWKLLCKIYVDSMWCASQQYYSISLYKQKKWCSNGSLKIEWGIGNGNVLFNDFIAYQEGIDT